MTEFDTFKPRLDAGLSLTPEDLALMEEWEMDPVGYPVPSERISQTAVWFGTRALNAFGDIPVIGISLPPGTDLTVTNADWYWGTAEQSQVLAQEDPYAAMLDHATGMVERPVMAFYFLQEVFSAKGQIDKGPDWVLAGSQRRSLPNVQ